MLKALSDKTAKLLVKYGADPEMEDIYSYGIEGVISTLLILVFLIISGFILNKPLHMIVFILAWLPLRILVGGAHASSHWLCTIISVVLGTISVGLSIFWHIVPFAVTVVLSLICYFIFFAMAPVVHKNHPISQRRYKKTRIVARIYTTIECIAVIIIAILNSGFTSSALMGFLTTAVLVVIGRFSKNADNAYRDKG